LSGEKICVDDKKIPCLTTIVFIWTKTLFLPTENVLSYLEKYYVTTAVFLPGKNGFVDDKKMPSSTSSVLLGRKLCSYQQKTFSLTGKKNYSVTKPFCQAKKIFVDDKKFLLRRQAFYLDENHVRTSKTFCLTGINIM